MLRRTITSVLIIPFLIYVIYADFLNSVLLFLFVLALSYLGSKELHSLLKKIYGTGGKGFFFLWSFIPGLAFLVSCYINVFFKPNSVAILYLIGCYTVVLCAGTFLKFGLKRSAKPLLMFSSCYFCMGVLPLTLWIIKLGPEGHVLLYFLFFLGWLNDALAYFIGSFFGRTRGFIKYSPNKSLEGYIGSFVLTIVFAAILHLVLGQRLPFNFTESVAGGFLISVFSPLGDIFESIIKRKAGVKDSSGFLPGLGGVLDIFDSILTSLPFYYLYLKIIAVV